MLLLHLRSWGLAGAVQAAIVIGIATTIIATTIIAIATAGTGVLQRSPYYTPTFSIH